MSNKVQKLDCLRLYVPDLVDGEKFYSKALGMPIIWRTENEIAFQTGDGVGEIIIQNKDKWNETDIMVDDVTVAADSIAKAGGKVVAGPFSIKIGLCAVCEDKWGNQLVVLDRSKGLLKTDEAKNVVGNLD